MGKRKVINEENLENMLFPSKNDVLGMAEQLRVKGYLTI